MKWINYLERKLGKYAIKGLMGYIVGANALVFFLSLMEPQLIHALELRPQLVMQGEIWRLVTFVFIPPQTRFIIFIIFVLYFYYMVGTRLEYRWGSFRFNLYYLVGVLATIAASFLTGSPATPLHLNLSLFLAFATIYPEHQILFMLLLPIKVKYLALVYAASLMFTLLFSPLGAKVMALASLVNYLLFFTGDIVRYVKFRRKAQKGKKRFQAKMPNRSYVHRCAVCGRTEQDDPDLEFRYCSKCEGLYEYCMDHLKNHEHVKSSD